MTSIPRPQGRPLNTVVLTEALILGGTAVLFLAKWLRGQLSFYIHPRYSLLVIAAGAVLLLMAAVRLRDVYAEGPRRPGWVYLLLATPLLLGVLVPARPLGADTLAGRGAELNAVADNGRAARLTSDSSTWNLLDWGTALSVRGDELVGQPADVVGFVFHGEGLGPDAFYAVRYVVTCCAADGAGVGLPVVWAGGGALPENGWVRVRGTIDRATLDGVEQPVLRAEAVEPVPQPDSPYLYP
ncbi:MAG TPA: TIGR03943 family protein [Chloroflexaceae bacterium]|nr:TIGR03943 family protein [Chloroflexaceae bacterium]